MIRTPHARTEFWQMLARSLLVPRGESFLAALREDFAPDLEAVARECAVSGLEQPIQRLRSELSKVGDATELLAVYSRLFLTPPVPAPLNVGRYLDGNRPGDSAQQIARLMAHHGVAQSDAINDAPDLLPTLLEYLALRIGQQDGKELDERKPTWVDVQELRVRFLLPSSRRIAAQAKAGEAEYGLPSVYSSLIGIVVSALEDRDGRLFPPMPATGTSSRESAVEQPGAAQMVACRICGRAIASARDIGVIIERLRDAGLPSDHLSVCPDCRGGNRRTSRVPTESTAARNE